MRAVMVEVVAPCRHQIAGMPGLRHSSFATSPALCSFNIPMICSSVDLDRFIVRLLYKKQTNPRSRAFQGNRDVDHLLPLVI